MNRPLSPLALLVALAACGGSSGPPPPVAKASASPAADDLRPMSSRDAARSSASGPAAAGPGDTLPPGHPPIGGSDPHGNDAPDPHGKLAAAGPRRSAGSITGTITLGPKLTVGPSDVLYVMAKKGASTIAVRRIEKPRFPLGFEISGADAMMSGLAFDGPVDIVARLSKTGDAIASKGDYEGSKTGVPVPAKGVSLTIDQMRQ